MLSANRIQGEEAIEGKGKHVRDSKVKESDKAVTTSKMKSSELTQCHNLQPPSSGIFPV